MQKEEGVNQIPRVRAFAEDGGKEQKVKDLINHIDHKCHREQRDQGLARRLGVSCKEIVLPRF